MLILMAWRNIWRNKFRSIVIMLSIVIGIFAGISILALYKGMVKSRIRTLIDTEVSHIQIHDPNFKKDYDPLYVITKGKSIVSEIQKLKSQKYLAARSITQGMLTTTTGSSGIQINGIIPEYEYKISELDKKIIEGNKFSDNKKNEIIIGKKKAEKMKLKIGSKTVLTFTDTSGNIVSSAFKVIAIYQSDNAPLDEKNVYIKMNLLNEQLNIGNNFHEIAILLNNDEDLTYTKKLLNKKFPDYKIESWSDISPETELLANTTNQYSYIIMVIIMFALAFGIINTMLMAVLERIREIGMMMALGTSKVRIFLLIFLETFFITILGTPVGIGIAWLIVGYYHQHGLDFSTMGREMMSSFGFKAVIYPEFPLEKLIILIVIIISTALLSCLFPAIKALQLSPIEALKK